MEGREEMNEKEGRDVRCIKRREDMTEMNEKEGIDVRNE